MRLLELSIVFFLFLTLCNCVTRSNYCNKDLCKKLVNGKYIFTDHIGCSNVTSVNRNQCPNDCEFIPMKRTMIDYILDLHNDLRNNVASGNLINHPSASRMTIMQWDDELAYLAELHAKTCIFEHDECRNTKNYKFCGQNIAKQQSTAVKNITIVIKELFDVWAMEHKFCNRSIIEKYANLPKEPIGHFTVLVSDKASRVGCAVHSCKEPTKIFKHIIHITCNYSYTNIKNYPIYKVGPTASKCTTGRDSKYKSLCSKREKITAIPKA